MEREQLRATIEACYKARMAGDKETLARLCAPDAKFEVVGAEHIVAAHPAPGPMDMAAALERIMSEVEMREATPVAVLIDGNRAAVRLRATMAYRGREPFDTELGHFWEFDKAGKVLRVSEFLDTALLAEQFAALG